MHDPAFVGHREPGRYAPDESQRLGEGEPSLCHDFGKAQAIQPFHGEVHLALGGDAMGDVVDDGRMRDFGEDVRFAQEAIRALIGVQELQRDDLAVVEVLGPIDHPHPACAGAVSNPESRADDVSGSHYESVSRRPPEESTWRDPALLSRNPRRRLPTRRPNTRGFC